MLHYAMLVYLVLFYSTVPCVYISHMNIHVHMHVYTLCNYMHMSKWIDKQSCVYMYPCARACARIHVHMMLHGKQV